MSNTIFSPQNKPHFPTTSDDAIHTLPLSSVVRRPWSVVQSRLSSVVQNSVVCRPSSVVLILLLLTSLGLSANAQSIADFTRSNYSPASYYSYAEPGDITILVNVWGTVRNPGLYEVPEGTTLSTLFSVAGGPAVAPRSDRDHRTITVRLSRREGGTPRIVFESVMEDDIFATDKDPTLRAGDILTVETVTRRPFSFREALPIISTAASVAIAITYFLR